MYLSWIKRIIKKFRIDKYPRLEERTENEFKMNEPKE